MVEHDAVPGSVIIAWDDSVGSNATIDGYYYVYSSEYPLFSEADLAYGPLDDPVREQADTPACDLCFYQIRNVPIIDALP